MGPIVSGALAQYFDFQTSAVVSFGYYHHA